MVGAKSSRTKFVSNKNEITIFKMVCSGSKKGTSLWDALRLISNIDKIHLVAKHRPNNLSDSTLKFPLSF